MKNALSVLLMVATTPALAQRAPEPVTPAIELAQTTGKLAGNADFCKLDPKLLDEFISVAKARIAIVSSDKIDRVLAELDFSNNYSLAATTEPAEGCEAFLQTVPDELGKLKE